MIIQPSWSGSFPSFFRNKTEIQKEEKKATTRSLKANLQTFDTIHERRAKIFSFILLFSNSYIFLLLYTTHINMKCSVSIFIYRYNIIGWEVGYYVCCCSIVYFGVGFLKCLN